jgi:hypothetical protein
LQYVDSTTLISSGTSKLVSATYNAVTRTTGSMSFAYTNGSILFAGARSLLLKFSNIGTDHYQVYFRFHVFVSCTGSRDVALTI